ncbi:Fic family protein [Petralouisia muris]|nr:hypothetical protein [Petralouisia muris]
MNMVIDEKPTLTCTLLETGQLKMTIPDKPKSKNQKYYSGPLEH